MYTHVHTQHNTTHTKYTHTQTHTQNTHTQNTHTQHTHTQHTHAQATYTHIHIVPFAVDLEEDVMVVPAASDADPAIEVGVAVVAAVVVAD